MFYRSFKCVARSSSHYLMNGKWKQKQYDRAGQGCQLNVEVVKNMQIDGRMLFFLIISFILGFRTTNRYNLTPNQQLDKISATVNADNSLLRRNTRLSGLSYFRYSCLILHFSWNPSTHFILHILLRRLN